MAGTPSYPGLFRGAKLYRLKPVYSLSNQNTPVGPVFTGQQNIFYDQHTLTSNVSLLDWSGINRCIAVCSQTYSCGGFPVGSDTITYTFIQAQINGTHVTSTEVSKQ